MQIDEKLLNKLEKLSALKISEEKRQSVINELSEIVNFVDRLNTLDLSQNQATIITLKGGTPLRVDKEKTAEVIENVLKNSPSHEGRFFSVPKIIE